MRRPSATSRRLAAACTLAALPFATAQTHKVQKPESVVRAVGVYEWTGDLQKPAAARLIPVTVFINGELEDAGIFEPQPIPFALLPGNQYILQQAGVSRGLLDLQSASKEPDADTGNVDGWWAFGTVTRELPSASPKLRPSRTLSSISTSKGDTPPVTTTASDSDTNRPANAPDPDRPTLRRRSSAPPSKPTTTPDTTSPSATPPDDPDRPSLKRRTSKPPADDTIATSTDSQQLPASAITGDPNRPILHRGVPAHGGPTEAAETRDLAKLAGLPKDLHQLVAVSDPANRPEHDFSRPWTDDAEHKSIATQLETLARAELAAYNPASPLAPDVPRSGRLVGQADASATPLAPTAGPSFKPSQGSTRHTPPPSTPAARRRVALAKAAAARKAAAQKPAPMLPLEDEELRAYTLSYGAIPTFVLTAHTPASANPTNFPPKSTSTSAQTVPKTPSSPPAETPIRYVTLVAQQDIFGHLQVAFSSVTDSAHLDRTPWMRLVGPVDVEASNRASLLFELREQGSRQFALYRVLSGHADPLFTTGSTQ